MGGKSDLDERVTALENARATKGVPAAFVAKVDAVIEEVAAIRPVIEAINERMDAIGEAVEMLVAGAVDAEDAGTGGEGDEQPPAETVETADDNKQVA